MCERGRLISALAGFKGPAPDIAHVRSSSTTDGGAGVESAELLVLGESLELGVVTAHFAVVVAANLECSEFLVERVIHQKAPDERVADAENQLHDFGGLQKAHDSRQDAENASFLAGRSELCGWRLRIQAAVARAFLGLDDRDLTFKAENGAGDIGDTKVHTGVIDQITGGEIVATVDHNVVSVEDIEHVLGGEAGVVRVDLHVGVQVIDGLLGGLDLRPAHTGIVVKDLPLQVGTVDDVGVDEPDGADAGCREVVGAGRAQAAGAEHEDTCAEELSLTFLADLGDDHVAAVTGLLLGRKVDGNDELVAHLLPGGEAPDHGRYTCISDELQAMRGEGRAHASGAIEHDFLVSIGELVFDPALQYTARNQRSAGEMTVSCFVGFANVDECHALLQALVSLIDGDFADLGFDGFEIGLEVAHDASTVGEILDPTSVTIGEVKGDIDTRVDGESMCDVRHSAAKLG